MIDDIINSVALLHGVKREDLCLVGRPLLIHELLKCGYVPDDIKTMMTTKIPEEKNIDGTYTSNIHVVYRSDLWMYRDKVIRRKLWRTLQ